MSDYELLRDKPNVGTVRWFIMKDGYKLSRDGEPEDMYVLPPVYACCYSRKKDAQKRIEELVEWDVYLERLFSQDFSRVYIWTADEWRQIESLAQKLKENGKTWVLGKGYITVQEYSRLSHWDAMLDLRKYRLDTTRNNAITRRVMAARYEAHELAGVEL